MKQVGPPPRDTMSKPVLLTVVEYLFMSIVITGVLAFVVMVFNHINLTGADANPSSSEQVVWETPADQEATQKNWLVNKN